MNQRLKGGADMTLFKRILCFSGIIVLVLSTLPLAVLCAYSHPYYDDFGFSLESHETWSRTHQLKEVIKTAYEHSKTIRQKWQGTYTGTFLTNLQPGLFGEKYYGLGPLFLLLFFVFCFFLLSFTLCSSAGMERGVSCGIAGWTVTYLLLFMPSIAEGIYWFNGGIGNTFIYSVIALSIVLGIKLCTSDKRYARILIGISLAVCAFILGGGSYTGGIFCLLVGLFFAIWLLLKHNKKGCVILAVTLLFLVCFMHSISAPGNQIRAHMIGASESAALSIIKALYYGTALIGQYITLPLLALTLLFLPIMTEAARSKFRHIKHPVLLCAAAYLLFCAQLTPTLYSGVFLGADRTVNTYFFSFVLLWLTVVYGVVCYLMNKAKAPVTVFISRKRTLAYLLAFVLLFGMGAMGTNSNSDNYYGVQNLNSVNAAITFVTKQANHYHNSMKSRSGLLNDTEKPVVVLPPIDPVPSCFMPDLLYRPEGDSIIPTLMQYYHKEKILREGENSNP